MKYLPPIFGIIGPQGSGKSFSCFKLLCQFADFAEYDLCFNFYVNLDALYEYCVSCGYLWLASRILHNRIRYKDSEDLEDFMDLPKTIYVMDEAGVYMNSREFQPIPKSFLHDLAQVRHDSKILVWCAQYADMVDRVLRELTAGYCQCLSVTRFNKKLGNYELYWQKIYVYNARQYKIYLSKVDSKMSGFKFWINSRKLADWHFEGVLSTEDKLIFDIYQSFGGRVGDYGELKKFNNKAYVVDCHSSFADYNDFKTRLEYV
jgi:hypothetical protein